MNDVQAAVRAGTGSGVRPRAGTTMTDDAGPVFTRRSTVARLALLEAQGDDLSVHEAMTLALQQATAEVGALGGVVHLPCETPDGLYLVASSGLPNKVTDEWAYLAIDRDLVPVRAMREGVLCWSEEGSPRIESHGAVAVPVPGTARPLGVLTLFLSDDRKPDASGCSFLTAVAGWSAQWLGQRTVDPAPCRGATGREPVTGRAVPADPLEPADATRSRGSAARQTARMAELTTALAEAFTTRDVVGVVADHVLPPFGADGLVIEANENGRLHVVGSVGYAEEFLEDRLEGLPTDANVLMTDVLRRRRPVFVESTADFVRRYPELRRMTHPDKNSWAFLPLSASGQEFGCCVISFALPRTFTDEERTLLTALSGLVAQALERARLYDAEHSRAQSLQRGLLPRSLPRLPAVTAAASYLPASEGAAVGGDWYDLIPLSADRVAMVVGDVMGHGIAEAATMGRLRTAVHTLADLEMPPDEMFGHLNDLVKELGDDSYVTCLYAVYDPVSRICTFCLAGHPPPVVVHPDGTLHRPVLVANPPLGAAEPPFDTQELLLPEQCVLVFYTDGLLRSVDRDADEGVALLVSAVADALEETSYFSRACDGDGGACLGRLCDLITTQLTQDRPRAVDDAALFLTHTRVTAPDDVASWALTESPTAASESRELVRRQLARWRLNDLEPTTEIVVSELVGNAIRHAKGPLRLRLLRSGSLICEVYDGSLTTPRIRRATQMDEGGRGLHLVSALSRRWGTRYLDDGKCIWAEQELTPDSAHRI
ncbi:SpoIIE family protein phosphatase [Streptomyces sp. WAC07094]|uniref:SpoIIE family protein phosphatase n=1 Tax=Streptomyces sp. WAC07094 TaxID=3072183 RepID=UPI002EA0C821|nr:SpoIIE family protein phosphatase [Streptomyces sp. WAC07094]